MDIVYLLEPNEQQPKPTIITQAPKYKQQPIPKINIYKPIEHRDEIYKFDNADTPPSEFAAASHAEFQAYEAYYKRIHQYRPSETISVSSIRDTSDRDPNRMDNAKIDGMASSSGL